MTAVDYAWARPGGAALKAAGVVAVGRYVGPAGWGKTITEPELDDLLGHGIVVWFVFEAGANDSSGGHAAGVANAQLALQNLPSAAAGAPIYFAVDSSVNPQSAVPYFQGIETVLPPARIGVYGEGALCQLLHDEGIATWFWQSESTSFAGNATTLPITHIQQRFAPSPVASTDLDILCKGDVGAVPRPAPTPPAAPPPAPVPPKVPIVLNWNLSGCNIADVAVFQGGVLVLATNGGVFNKGCAFHGSAAGQPYFTGRTASKLLITGQDSYQIVDTAGETYNYGG